VDRRRGAGRPGAVPALGVRAGVNYGAPLIGYYVPGLGSSRTAEWTVQGLHFAERCRLFIIIALGESLLVTGAVFADSPATIGAVVAFVVAFAGSVALWWIHFHRSAEAAGRVLAATADPGRLARSAYTYFHLPMVAGIIAVAAADELTVGHPGERATPASVALTLGGAMLFLAGHALFKRAALGELPRSHLAAMLMLAMLAPVGLGSTALVLSAAAGLVLLGLAAWETLSARRRLRRPHRSTV
jgi:low temperature requirement protein LtrA